MKDIIVFVVLIILTILIWYILLFGNPAHGDENLLYSKNLGNTPNYNSDYYDRMYQLNKTNNNSQCLAESNKVIKDSTKHLQKEN